MIFSYINKYQHFKNFFAYGAPYILVLMISRLYQNHLKMYIYLFHIHNVMLNHLTITYRDSVCTAVIAICTDSYVLPEMHFGGWVVSIILFVGCHYSLDCRQQYSSQEFPWRFWLRHHDRCHALKLSCNSCELTSMVNSPRWWTWSAFVFQLITIAGFDLSLAVCDITNVCGNWRKL